RVVRAHLLIVGDHDLAGFRIVLDERVRDLSGLRPDRGGVAKRSRLQKIVFAAELDTVLLLVIFFLRVRLGAALAGEALHRPVVWRPGHVGLDLDGWIDRRLWLARDLACALNFLPRHLPQAAETAIARCIPDELAGHALDVDLAS